MLFQVQKKSNRCFEYIKIPKNEITVPNRTDNLDIKSSSKHCKQPIKNKHLCIQLQVFNSRQNLGGYFLKHVIKGPLVGFNFSHIKGIHISDHYFSADHIRKKHERFITIKVVIKGHS
jgi:lysozyme family protein